MNKRTYKVNFDFNFWRCLIPWSRYKGRIKSEYSVYSLEDNGHTLSKTSQKTDSTIGREGKTRYLKNSNRMNSPLNHICSRSYIYFLIYWSIVALCVFQVALVAKNLPANARDIRNAGSIPGSGRSPGGGHSNPLHYSCLENHMDREAWRVTVHRVAQSQTRLKQLSMNV